MSFYSTNDYIKESLIELANGLDKLNVVKAADAVDNIIKKFSDTAGDTGLGDTGDTGFGDTGDTGFGDTGDTGFVEEYDDSAISDSCLVDIKFGRAQTTTEQIAQEHLDFSHQLPDDKHIAWVYIQYPSLKQDSSEWRSGDCDAGSITPVNEKLSVPHYFVHCNLWDQFQDIEGIPLVNARAILASLDEYNAKNIQDYDVECGFSKAWANAISGVEKTLEDIERARKEVGGIEKVKETFFRGSPVKKDDQCNDETGLDKDCDEDTDTDSSVGSDMGTDYGDADY